MIQTSPRNPNTPLVTHVWEQILSKDNVQLCLQVNHNFSLLKQRLDSGYVLVSTLFFFFFFNLRSTPSLLSVGLMHCAQDPLPLDQQISGGQCFLVDPYTVHGTHTLIVFILFFHYHSLSLKSPTS